MKLLKNKKAGEETGFTYTQIVIFIAIIALIIVAIGFYLVLQAKGTQIFSEAP